MLILVWRNGAAVDDDVNFLREIDMSYCALAESFASPSVRFDQVYCDITDAVHPDDDFTRAELVGNIPAISKYSQKVQQDILAVVLRDMQKLSPECDRIQRVGRSYRWVFSKK